MSGWPVWTSIATTWWRAFAGWAREVVWCSRRSGSASHPRKWVAHEQIATAVARSRSKPVVVRISASPAKSRARDGPHFCC